MGGTLLLADDSITIQKVVELTFAESEHKVVAVGSGRELFARLAEIKPDVVLCDVVMPDLNGYEVCQTLKSDPNTLHLPVVLLTGTFEPFDRDRALAAGCDAIVTKPFEARELINVVEDLLRRAQSVAAIPMPGESGGLGDHGIPDGVPSLDFSTTGFDELAAQIPPPPPMPEEGIELTSSSLGDSRPSKQVPAPPELAEPDVPTAVSALSQSFAFGGDEAEAPLPAPMAEAFAPAGPAAAPEARSFTAEPPSFAPEPPAFVSEPPRPGVATPVAPEPFAVGEKGSESAHELFATEPAEPEPVLQPALAPPPRVPVGEDVPAQHLPARPTLVSQPANEPPPPDRIAAEAAFGAAAPLAVGALSAEVVEHVMRRVKELIPPPSAVPASPAPADLLTDEHVERIARRAAELVPQPPAPLTAAELLTDEHVERVAKRAAELVPPPAPAAAAVELSDEQIEKIAKRVLDLATPVIERIAWEIVPDMAEMMVRKRILELESAAEEEN